MTKVNLPNFEDKNYEFQKDTRFFTFYEKLPLFTHLTQFYIPSQNELI